MAQIPKIIHSSWHEHLQPLFDDPKMEMLKMSVLPKTPFYPEGKDIFRVFEMPLPAIKVVALGQDPYPNKGQANGLAFAVNNNVPMPASLKIIHKEILAELQVKQLDEGGRFESPEWRTLYHWHKQGVFLLNAGLTVEAGKSGSHLNMWNWFTREVIRVISIHNNPIWLMWGAKAKGYIGMIHGFYKWNGTYRGREYNYVLEADHPAAETYPDSKYHFSGCNHFSECNKILQLKEQTVIQW